METHLLALGADKVVDDMTMGGRREGGEGGKRNERVVRGGGGEQSLSFDIVAVTTVHKSIVNRVLYSGCTGIQVTMVSQIHMHVHVATT